MKYSIESRVWISTEEGIFLGEGRVALLKQIDKHGSISKAAKEMKMSYKKAWRMVNTMNDQGPDLLVTRTTGGEGGGGSVLSEIGKKAVQLFDEIKAENRTQLAVKSKSLEF